MTVRPTKKKKSGRASKNGVCTRIIYISSFYKKKNRILVEINKQKKPQFFVKKRTKNCKISSPPFKPQKTKHKNNIARSGSHNMEVGREKQKKTQTETVKAGTTLTTQQPKSNNRRIIWSNPENQKNKNPRSLGPIKPWIVAKPTKARLKKKYKGQQN